MVTGGSQSLAHLIVALGVVLVGWITVEYLRHDRTTHSLWPDDPVGISLVLLCRDQGEYLEYGVRRLRSILDGAGTVQGQVILVDVGSADDTGVVALRLADALHGVDAVVTDGPIVSVWAEAVVTAHRRALYPLILCYAPVDPCGWEKMCDLVAAFVQAGQNRPIGE